ncbi:unnamed protein product [Schistosoma margrebowiei]|uniref:Uncharacterized protein n=1 Tax=Schistosoma margrebowiei TaxID=48269 RepID=A0A183LR66_9TREM|nr:unnamed protein product [Schistosoma margrebowiei]
MSNQSYEGNSFLAASKVCAYSLWYTERPDNVGDREDQSSCYGNEEIQLGSTGNQRNPLDPSWTTKAKSGEMLLYSGHEEEIARHTQGVALTLSNEARIALTG